MDDKDKRFFQKVQIGIILVSLMLLIIFLVKITN